jgi:hypothetical protein
MLLSHEEGVLPTSAAIVPTLSLTSVNILVMLLSIQPIRSSFMASSIFSRINPNISPPFGYAGVAGSEQARQERDKGRADEYHTTTGHQLLDSLALGTGIVIAVPLHEVDHAPHGKASAKGDNEGLQNGNRLIDKFHK